MVERCLWLATMAMPALSQRRALFSLPTPAPGSMVSGVAHHSSAQREVATPPLNGLNDLRKTLVATLLRIADLNQKAQDAQNGEVEWVQSKHFPKTKMRKY